MIPTCLDIAYAGDTLQIQILNQTSISAELEVKVRGLLACTRQICQTHHKHDLLLPVPELEVRLVYLAQSFEPYWTTYKRIMTSSDFFLTVGAGAGKDGQLKNSQIMKNCQK